MSNQSAEKYIESMSSYRSLVQMSLAESHVMCKVKMKHLQHQHAYFIYLVEIYLKTCKYRETKYHKVPQQNKIFQVLGCFILFCIFCIFQPLQKIYHLVENLLLLQNNSQQYTSKSITWQYPVCKYTFLSCKLLRQLTGKLTIWCPEHGKFLKLKHFGT